MASEILSRVAEAELECEKKIKAQKEKAQQAATIARQKAEEQYADEIAKAKASAESRLAQAAEYAGVLKAEQMKRTEEEIAALKANCQSKESPVVLALSKKILELA